MNTTGPCMGDNEYLADILTTEKNLIKCYADAVIESSCPNMRQVMSAQMQQTAQDQFKVFQTMSTRGQYPTPPAPDNQVQQAQQKYSQLQGALC